MEVVGSPGTFFTDRGTEFCGKAFKKFLEKNFIIQRISQSPDVKAANAERLNRTLKTRIWKYFTKCKKFRYMNVLQSMAHTINTSYTATICCQPADVTMENESKIRERLFGPSTLKQSKTPNYKFKVGDEVRIAKEKGKFEKGYLPNFTQEIFFYSAELVKAIPEDDEPRRRRLHYK